MAHPYHHALSSVKKWGGTPEDYQPIHDWFDATKEILGDFRHRALRHHAQGIFEAERVFGTTITISTGRFEIRQVAEGGHVNEYLEVVDTKLNIVVDTWNTRGGAEADRDQRNQKQIPVRWIGEQHVSEDLGMIPSAADWLRAIKPEPWMNRSRKLSRELEAEATVAL